MAKPSLSLQVIDGKAIDPLRWDAFMEASPQGSLFVRHRYASQAAPGWQAAILANGDTWVAAMPFFPTTKRGISLQLQPPFCQCWGICFAPMDGQPMAAQWSLKKQYTEAFLPVLKAPQWLQVNFAPEFDYLFPLKIAGFAVSPRITYRIALEQPLENITREYASTLVRQLRKAEKQALVFVPDEPEKLIVSYGSQLESGRTLLGGAVTRKARWEKLVRELAAAGDAAIFSVRNPEGETLTTGWFGKHGHKVYYLGGAATGEMHSHASPFLLASAIAHYREAGFSIFDFEGSMLPGVERFFRQFGGTPVTYFEVMRKRKWLQVLDIFRG